MTYSVTVDNPFRGDGELHNTATIEATGTDCDGATPGRECSTTTATTIKKNIKDRQHAS
ncbi:hypothetical protein K7B06_00215 [Streptomyces erythrochromogenes]|nr:hypothetical protein [Streptomyces erythrochromogenes]